MLLYPEYQRELDSCVMLHENFFKRKLREECFCIMGAVGYIGSCLVDWLLVANDRYQLGIEVRAWDKNEGLLESRFGTHETDCLHTEVVGVNEDTRLQVKADDAIHAAGNTSPLDDGAKPVDTIRTNTFGIDRMIRPFQRCMARFLFRSSVEMCGLNLPTVTKI